MNQQVSNQGRYELTPMQRGMLVHNLSAPEAGVNLEQIICRIPERVSAGNMQRAWEAVIGRHEVLRTSFHWDAGAMGQQQVNDSCALEWRVEDWRRNRGEEQEKRLRDFLRNDRRRGFALDRAPLSRVVLIRTGEEDCTMIWTAHHAVVDGRSFGLVLREVFECYEALESGKEMEWSLARPFREYVEWLRSLELGRYEAYWRGALQGLGGAAPLPFPESGKGELDPWEQGEEKLRVSRETTLGLKEVAGRSGFTLNTLVQGAWALLLSRYYQEEEVVFGGVWSGRNPDVPGIESMVGVFIHTLPVRVMACQEMRVSDWLRQLGAQHREIRRYQEAPLEKIHEWSGIGTGGGLLFESILIFDHASLEEAMEKVGGGWRGRQVLLEEQTNFPVTVYAYGGRELELQIRYQRNRFSRVGMTRVLGQFAGILEGVAEDPEQRVGDVELLTCGEREQLLEAWNLTWADYCRDGCIHQGLEKRVELGEGGRTGARRP